MAVNVSKLWRDARFQKLDNNSKLLYIYLITSPDLNTLGLLIPNLEVIKLELSFDDSEFRDACKELRRYYIRIFEVDDIVYFFMPDHFPTLPKSVAVSKKATKDKKALSSKVVGYMEAHDMMPDIEKHVEFKAPTVEEVEKYALSKGYLIDAKTVVEFYEGKARLFNKKGWYDSRGKAVKDWRGKLRKVWFKDERKLKKCEDAPKGFEYFFVKENEEFITPDHWKNDLPVSKEGFLQTKLLQREYNKRISES